MATKRWTVIGYYTDNDQPWARCVTAANYELAQEEARHQTARALLEDRGEDLSVESEEDERELITLIKEASEEVVVTGVVEGDHQVYGGDNEHG